MRLRVTNDSALGDFMLRAREQGQSTRHRLGSGLAVGWLLTCLPCTCMAPRTCQQYLYSCTNAMSSPFVRGPAALPALTFLDLNSCLIQASAPLARARPHVPHLSVSEQLSSSTAEVLLVAVVPQAVLCIP